MQGLLIANEDRDARSQLAALFEQDGYQVTTTDSVVNALEGILNKTIQVVVLAGELNEAMVSKLVPLLKKCNQQLSIILVADEIPLNLLRRIRKEGIFYHALTPAGEDGQDEIYQAVHYAFRNYREHSRAARSTPNLALSLRNGKAILSTLLLLLALNVRG